MRRALPFAAAAVLLALAALPALAGPEKLALNGVDQAAARRVGVERSDLVGGGWSGGAVKPELPLAPPCPSDGSFHPDEARLVVTGAAASSFTGHGVALESNVQLLKTASMAAASWSSWETPGLAGCLTQSLENFGTNQAPVLFGRLTLPRAGSFTLAYRALVDDGNGARFVADWFFAASGRARLFLATETLLASSVQTPAGILSAEKADLTSERRLLARMVARGADAR